MIGSILSGKRPSQRSVEEAIRDVAEAAFGRKMTQAQIDELLARARAAATGAAGGPSSSHSSSASGARSSRSNGPDPELEKARKVSWARRTLGFTAKEPLTKDQVKHRYRELAKKHHPDRGGDVAKMTAINQAMDILTGPG